MAEKYTYDDVITAKDILTGAVDKESLIGKTVYYSDLLTSIVMYASSDDGKGKLLEVDIDDSIVRPFLVDTPGGDKVWRSYIIPKKEKSYEERQAEWVEKVGLKAGDKVRILRKFDDCKQGFHCGMNPEGQMDCLVGKVVEVMEIDARSICLYNEDKSDWWVWPYFCLEKVELEYVPFDLGKPEDRDAIRGKWVQDSRHGNEWMIVGFYLDETGGQGYKAKLSRKNAGFTGSELLERFTFLDGTPIGKLKEAGA